MEELGQFDDEFHKKQKELLKKQAEFEQQQREYSENMVEIEAKELKKNRLISWAILGGMILFILFLAWMLLF